MSGHPEGADDQRTHQGEAEASPNMPEIRLEGPELEQALLRQIDHYFSRANLSQDKFLVNKMNADMFVGVDVIAAFKKMQQLTDSIEVIKAAMRKSPSVILSEDETQVKPSFKLLRNTIILRDIPSATPVDEVRTIFEHEKCARPAELRPDYADTWFAKFDSEDATLLTFNFIRGQKFQDKPIQARIKAETLLNSGGKPLSATAAAFDPNASAGAYAYNGGYPQTFYPATPEMMGNMGYMWDGNMGRPYYPKGDRFNKGERRQRDPNAPQQPRGDRQQGGQGKGPGMGGQNRRAPGGGNGGAPAAGQQGGRPAEAGAKPAATGARKSDGQNIQLGLTNFPPLPTKGKAGGKGGYADDFVKYDVQQLKDLITGMGAPAKPAPASQDCPVVLSAPITELEISKPIPEPSHEPDPSPERQRTKSVSEDKPHVEPLRQRAPSKGKTEPKAQQPKAKAAPAPVPEAAAPTTTTSTAEEPATATPAPAAATPAANTAVAAAPAAAEGGDAAKAEDKGKGKAMSYAEMARASAAKAEAAAKKAPAAAPAPATAPATTAAPAAGKDARPASPPRTGGGRKSHPSSPKKGGNQGGDNRRRK